MKKSIAAAIAAALLAVVGPCPCAQAMKTPGPKVVVSIKPLHALVAGVMQGVAMPQLLIKGGGSPHGYVLRPSEARALANADLVVWVGHSLESFLEKPLATLAGNAHQLELMETLAGQLLPLRQGGSWGAHAHHHPAHVQHAADQEGPPGGTEKNHPPAGQHHESQSRTIPTESHGDAAEEFNAHLWLSPLLAKQIVAQTAAALGRIDQSHQTAYQRNAQQVQQRLDELHRQLADKLAPVKNVPYIVFHDAYHYFETAYGLNAVGSITIDQERRPGAKRISEIRKRIKELRARCVFSEPQFQPRLVATIIEGTGARTGILDPLGAGLETGPEGYFQLLHNLADNLLAGLR